MIKTKDLRRGNWVTSGKGDFPMYVTAIFEGEVYLNFEGNEGDVWESKEEDLKPIPLTPEVLENIGFFVDNNKAHIVYNEFGNIYQLNRVGESFQSTYLATEIPYLHTLQNHYYFSTNTELTYKP